MHLCDGVLVAVLAYKHIEEGRGAAAMPLVEFLLWNWFITLRSSNLRMSVPSLGVPVHQQLEPQGLRNLCVAKF